MQHTIKLLFTATLLTSIISCVKKVEVTVPYDGDKIVLKSIIRQDSSIYATLTQTTRPNYYQNAPLLVIGTIAVFEDNVPVTTLIRATFNTQTWYVSNYKAKPGKTYTLKATAPGLPNAEAADKMVSKPNYTLDSFYENTNNDYVVKLNIKDLPVENFYQLKIYNADTNTSATGPRYKIDYNTPYYFSVSALGDNSSIFDIIDGVQYRELYFSDAKFNGKTISPKIVLENYNSFTRIAVVLESISKSYYRFLVSSDNQYNNSGNPFSEPSQVYTNVLNGYGVVGTMADSITFKRKQ